MKLGTRSALCLWSAFAGWLGAVWGVAGRRRAFGALSSVCRGSESVTETLWRGSAAARGLRGRKGFQPEVCGSDGKCPARKRRTCHGRHSACCLVSPWRRSGRKDREATARLQGQCSVRGPLSRAARWGWWLPGQTAPEPIPSCPREGAASERVLAAASGSTSARTQGPLYLET